MLSPADSPKHEVSSQPWNPKFATTQVHRVYSQTDGTGPLGCCCIPLCLLVSAPLPHQLFPLTQMSPFDSDDSVLSDAVSQCGNVGAGAGLTLLGLFPAGS